MSNKNRLDESTIRRFMGLAGLEPIGEGFLDRMSEEDEEAMAPPEEEVALPMDDAAAEAPVDDAAPADPAAADAAAEIAQDVASAVADAMTDALGKHGVTVDAGDAAPEAGAEEELPGADLEADLAPAEAEPPMDDEMPLDETTETTDAEEVTETSETDEDPIEETKGDSLTKLESAGVSLVDDESVVQEVARRVAERLLKTARKQ